MSSSSYLSKTTLYMKTFSFFLLLLLGYAVDAQSQRQKIWLDADTGNEMDDVFAIVRLLWEHEQLNITGLSSAHFNNADLIAFEKWNQYPTKDIHPVEISQALNEDILQKMGLDRSIPHPIGADRQMGRAWGGFTPRPSPATEAMMQVINQLLPGEKLDILTLGAVTNVASLIALDTSVLDKIRVFSLGGGYLQDRQAWNKNEFNVRCDLNAFDFLLNQIHLDWTLMPIHTIMEYKMDREEVYAKMDEERPVEQLMEKRWRETNPQDKTRILWDLGLVQAYLLPQFSNITMVNVPPENGTHLIKVFTKVDTAAFSADFWQTLASKRR